MADVCFIDLVDSVVLEHVYLENDNFRQRDVFLDGDPVGGRDAYLLLLVCVYL